MDVLTKAEEFFESLQIDKPRTPEELEVLFAEVRSGFKASPELCKASRPSGRPTKKYFEEVYPLTLFARRLYRGRSDVLCEPNFDDTKSFDSAVTIGHPSQRIRSLIEFTHSKDGLDESRRMKVLNQEGHVSLTGSIKLEDTKRPHRYTVENETQMRSIGLRRCLGRILDRLDRKAGPKYGGVNYLVIVFDDILGFHKPDELTQLRIAIESSASLSRLYFKTLILLGSPDETWLEFRLSE
jgi:hypothetical protein